MSTSLSTLFPCSTKEVSKLWFGNWFWLKVILLETTIENDLNLGIENSIELVDVKGGILIKGVLLFLSNPSTQEELLLTVKFLFSFKLKSKSNPLIVELIALYSQTGKAPLIDYSVPVGSIII